MKKHLPQLYLKILQSSFLQCLVRKYMQGDSYITDTSHEKQTALFAKHQFIKYHLVVSVKKNKLISVTV